MIHEFEEGMDCINKLNTMHYLIQLRDAEMEFHPTYWETKGTHLLIGSWPLIKKMTTTLFPSYFTTKKHKRGHYVINYVFGILKNTFKKLLNKYELSVVF
jgi:hypothetical protein